MPPITSSQKLMVGQFMTLTGMSEKTAAKVSSSEVKVPRSRSVYLTGPSSIASQGGGVETRSSLR